MFKLVYRYIITAVLILPWAIYQIGQLVNAFISLIVKISFGRLGSFEKDARSFLDRKIEIKTIFHRQLAPSRKKKVNKKASIHQSFRLSPSAFQNKLLASFGVIQTSCVRLYESMHLSVYQFRLRVLHGVQRIFSQITARLQRPKSKTVSIHTSPVQVVKAHQTNQISHLRIKLLTVIVCLSVVSIIYSVKLIEVAQDLPSPTKLSELHTPSTTEFYDRNGKLLYRLYEGRNRTIIPLSAVPKDLINATIAIEDKHFYQHQGVDFLGILRSLVVLVKDHQVQGGSTLTQQLIKNTLLTTDRTWQRKTKELVLALWAETIFTKQDILQMYFNEAPYGGPAWGIEAAAQTYFNKSAHELTLAESAYLAGLPVSPTTYSPYGSNPELGLNRQKDVLQQMLVQKYISQDQYDQAASENLTFSKPIAAIKAPHFVMYLRSVLAQKYGEKVVSQGGLKITTTLDLDVQEMAEKVLAEEVEKVKNLNVTNGAVMITDPTNGQILAMVGSKNYDDPKIGNFNVTISPRQPGSSIKPITYATAFKQGYSPGSVMIDAPITFHNQWETYTPVNYDGRFHGVIPIRTALGSSYNIPAVKTLSLVGIPNMIKTAQDLGITTFNDQNRFGLSLTLGGGEVKMIDMMSVYGTFADNGIMHPTNGVLKITDSYGAMLEDNTHPDENQVLDPAVAYMITDVLMDNNARTPAFGPNSLLKIPGHSVAVKTGTTDLKRDNWTFGYTPNYVVGVWVGNNDNTPMNPQLSSGVTGAAPIWNRIMLQLIQDQPNVAFVKPTNVTQVLVDGHKDLGITGITPKSALAYTRRSSDPTQKQTVSFTDPFTTYTVVQDQPQQQP